MRRRRRPGNHSRLLRPRGRGCCGETERASLLMKLAEQFRSLYRRHATALLALALLALLLQDIFGAHGVLAMRRSQKEVEQIQREIKKLSDENCALEQTVNALKT